MSPQPPSSQQAAPNILFVLTDDQGPWALGRESPELVTPTLDRLAEEGTYLERFFCASPVCSPARASLLTGRMPSAHGVHDWLRPEGVGRPGPQGGYLEGIPTIAGELEQAGYRCAMAGKWHVGYSHEPAAGYDYWYTHRLGGGSYYHAPIWEFDADRGRTTAEPRETTEPRYFTDAIGDHALDFLRRHAAGDDDRPFFLQLATTAPHDPWTSGNHPDQLLDLYAQTDFPSVPAPEPHPWFRREAFPDVLEHRHRNLAGYAAAVTGVDRMLSRVLAELEEQDLLEDTIVLFTSDNGFSCGHHGIWGKGNGTFPLNFWENSIRVPFIAWGPGRIAAGHASDQLISATSLFETVLELAGVTAAPDRLRAGRSFAPLLTGDEGAEKTAASQIVVLDEYGDNRMIRTPRWKYVARRRGPEELYDLDADPQEQEDLSGDPAFAALREDLSERLRSSFARSSESELDGWQLAVSGHGQRRPLGGQDRQGAFEQ